MVILGPPPADPCAWCGAELNETWLDVTALGSSFDTVRGPAECPTVGCTPRCPVCHREPGDIHGPDCGEVMAAKLGDLRPCTIARADCGSRMVET